MKKINKAFTLVELIVVITILAVLWTISFVSFQWYAASSRDSVRITDLSNISKVLKLNTSAGVPLLIPENAIDITSSWSVLVTQWQMWNKLLSYYWINNGGIDPLDKEPYVYSINNNKTKYQLLWFLESENFLSTSINKTFADNQNKIPRLVWDYVWIMMNQLTNEALVKTVDLDSVDIDWSTENLSIIFDETSVIKGKQLQGLKNVSSYWTYKSCFDLLNNQPELKNKDWYYFLNFWWKIDSTYCDMTNDGWGWSLYTWKWWHHFSFTGWLAINLDMINAIDFEHIRYDYKTPMWVKFPLIYKPFSKEEWKTILKNYERVPELDWNSVGHYANNTDFTNAFSIWEGNTSSITLLPFHNVLKTSNITKMLWRMDWNRKYTMLSWTAFWHDTSVSNLLRFPSTPYNWTYVIWNETFPHIPRHIAWNDWREIMIWLK